MAGQYTQRNRFLRVQTPLGPDALLLTGLRGCEGISQLFHFTLDLLAEPATLVPFEKLLAQPVRVEVHLLDGTVRYIHGMIKSLTQGLRDQTFVHYQAEMVPRFWLWTKNVQSRIFQELSVPDILQQVLGGLEGNLQLKLSGSFSPRDFCVQYGESDFAFASRLMEEEGIFYFFEHTADDYHMVLCNNAQACLDIAEPKRVRFEEMAGGTHDDVRIAEWRKTQEVCAEKFSLWDHCFQMPGHTLEASASLPPSVQVGVANHPLAVSGGNLEMYNFPGGYATRVDGVDPGGGDRSDQLEALFSDGQRTCQLRMEEQAARSIAIEGAGNCGRLTPGQAFELVGHVDASGAYLVTRVEHQASIKGGFRSGEETSEEYRNTFQCLPRALPYRPPLATERPTMVGLQTATVIGPPGEQIFTDKFGRVKVRFHWDRPGRQPQSFAGEAKVGWPTRGVAASGRDGACWIRVAQQWAGKGFGALHIPRVGQEVVVAFVEGNPDDPLIVGSVYNSANMPPYPLPDYKHHSGIVTQSQFGQQQNASEIRFEDGLGQEHLVVHSERDLHHNAENNHRVNIGNDQQIYVGNDHGLSVGANHHVQVGQNLVINVGQAGAGGGSGSGGAADGSGGAASATLGSGTGGANAADYIFSPNEPWTDGKISVKTPNYLTYIKGLNDTVVGGLNSIIVFGVDSKFVLGGMIVIATPFQVNIHAGWRLEMNKSRRLTIGSISETRIVDGTIVEVATQPISQTSPVAIRKRVGASSIEMLPAALTLRCGGSRIVLTNNGITLVANGTLSVTSLGIEVDATDVDVDCNDVSIDAASFSLE